MHAAFAQESHMLSTTVYLHAMLSWPFADRDLLLKADTFDLLTEVLLCINASQEGDVCLHVCSIVLVHCLHVCVCWYGACEWTCLPNTARLTRLLWFRFMPARPLYMQDGLVVVLIESVDDAVS